jgi:hypothetical protein
MNYQVNIKAIKDYMLWLYEMQEAIFFYQLDEHFEDVENHYETICENLDILNTY